jgi:DNA-binding GntR family transcriptional regulator
VQGRDAAAPVRGRRASKTLLAGLPGRQRADERLRQAILAGDMAPGQRLIEEELAGMLGVTRASLRGALFDLAADGLVERIPNRGARVRVITIAEAVAITECRMVLEGLCAAKAAELVTEPQVARLQELGQQLQRSVADGESLKYSALNHELHRLVREISGQTVAARLLERLNGQLVRHQFQLSLRPGRAQASLGEHLAIIAAITGRRPAEAEQATRRHLQSVIAALLDQQEQQKQCAGPIRPVTSMSYNMKPLCKRTPTIAKRTTQRCHTVLYMYARSQSERMRTTANGRTPDVTSYAV